MCIPLIKLYSWTETKGILQHQVQLKPCIDWILRKLVQWLHKFVISIPCHPFSATPLLKVTEWHWHHNQHSHPPTKYHGNFFSWEILSSLCLSSCAGIVKSRAALEFTLGMEIHHKRNDLRWKETYPSDHSSHNHGFSWKNMDVSLILGSCKFRGPIFHRKTMTNGEEGYPSLEFTASMEPFAKR